MKLATNSQVNTATIVVTTNIDRRLNDKGEGLEVFGRPVSRSQSPAKMAFSASTAPQRRQITAPLRRHFRHTGQRSPFADSLLMRGVGSHNVGTYRADSSTHGFD